MLAVFLCFIAATNSGEQVRRALFRAGGTAIGIVVGDLLVHLTGGHVWSSLLIVLVALFFGIYLIRVNYMFMTIGITVTMSQLYVQFGEFSWSLLLLRLAETAIGVAAVVVTVLVIVPLRPQRVLTTAVLLLVHGAAGARRGGARAGGGGAAAAAAARPRRRRRLRRARGHRGAAAAGHVRPQLRAADRAAVGRRRRPAVRPVARRRRGGRRGRSPTRRHGPATAPCGRAADQLRSSLDAVEHRLRTGERGSYVRSAALVALALDDVRAQAPSLQHALRDLTLLDGALARLATALQMEVADHDTGTGPRPAPAAPTAGARGPAPT